MGDFDSNFLRVPPPETKPTEVGKEAQQRAREFRHKHQQHEAGHIVGYVSEAECQRLMAAFSAEESAKHHTCKYDLALHSLTPGGSEFAHDEKACVAHVRARYSMQHNTIIKFKLEADALRAELSALRAELQKLKSGITE